MVILRIQLFIFFLIFYFSGVKAQRSGEIDKLKKEYEDLLKEERDLKSNLATRYSYLQTLDDLQQKLKDIERLKRDSSRLRKEQEQLQKEFSDNSAAIKREYAAYNAALKAIPSLENTLRIVKDSLRVLRQDLGDTKSITGREVYIDTVQARLYNQSKQLLRESAMVKMYQPPTGEYLFGLVSARAVQLIRDSGIMDLALARQSDAFAGIVTRVGKVPKNIADTVLFIRRVHEGFMAYEMAAQLLESPYNPDSTTKYIGLLQRSVLFTGSEKRFDAYKRKISDMLVLLENYCGATYNFWTEVKKLSNLIPEIATVKMQRFIPQLQQEYQYLLRQAKPVLNDLKAAEKSANLILPKLKCK